LTLCAVCCALMIVKVKEKLDTTPVIVTFAESATNIWHVPFPAVTICPLTKSRQTVFNFTRYASMKIYKEKLFDDYEKSVQNLFHKMAEDIHDNSTWISDKFKKEVISLLYGDTISERLESLLRRIFEAISSDAEFFQDFQRNNGSVIWIEEKFKDFKKSSKSLASAVDGYYEEWESEL